MQAVNTENTQHPELARRRIIQLKPNRELAQRIDVTAAMRGQSAPELVREILERELPYVAQPQVRPETAA